MKVKDAINALEKFSKNKPICSDCLSILNKCEDDDGYYLYCPNEMCLNETEYDLKGNKR